LNCIKDITNLKRQKKLNKELYTIKENPSESANYINYHFKNVGKSLAETIKNSYQPQNDFYKSLPSYPHSIGVIEPDAAEINSIITNLKTESAAGWDEVPTVFIKLARIELPVLTHLGITVFQQGIFPKLLKRSIIHPIFKAGSRHDINNYRPISVLPVISKILEKLINTRLHNTPVTHILYIPGCYV
jgi:hypothetical protein